LRYNNERFYQLAALVMEKELADFMGEFTEQDSYVDPYFKVTLLHMAAASGTNETIAYLIQQGIHVDSPDKDGNTPLHLAALCGHEVGVNGLLSLGAEKSITNKRGHAPWQVALTGELLTTLIPEATKKKYKFIPQKSLYEAVETEDIPTTTQLLEMDIHPNLLNHNDYQAAFLLPLHIAVEKQNLDLTELLLEHDARPSAPYLNFNINLENAIGNSDTQMVELLLRYGADPNHKMRRSLLHFAVDKNLIKIMELLLQHGADPEVQVEGHYFYHPPLRDARSVEAIQVLIKYGAITDPQKMKDFLVWPLGRGDIAVVKEFIRIGVPVNSSDLWSDVIRGSNREIVIELSKVLLDAGLDVNLPLKYYGSLLSRAIYYQHIDLVKLFLEYGADLTSRELDSGYTPYELAAHLLLIDIRDLLAVYMKKAGLPIPVVPSVPTVNQVKSALSQDKSDLVQLSLYHVLEENRFEQMKTLKTMLGYPHDVLPYSIPIKAEEDEECYEEWDEDYQPPLSDYQVIFHTNDPRCCILLVNWYDDFAYSTISHLHVRCERKDEEKIRLLFQEWCKSEEDEFEMKRRYKLGVYTYDWKQSLTSDEDKERLLEVENFYLSAVKEIHQLMRL